MNRGLSRTNLMDRSKGDLILAWDFQVDSAIVTAAAVTGRNTVFASIDGTVYNVDTELGELDWSVNVGSEVYASPLIDKERNAVYICDASGGVTRLNLDDGNTVWQWSTGTPDSIYSSPNVDDKGRIFFGSYDGLFYALDPNGTLAWRYTGCNNYIHTSPSVGWGMVFFGSCDGYLRCLSTNNGTLIWSFRSAYIPSSPSINGEYVHFGSFDQRFYTLDILTGEQVWNTTLGGDIYSSPAVSSDKVVVGCDDGFLYCLNRTNGEILWKLDLGPGKLESSPVLTSGLVVETYHQGLVLVHLENGSIYRTFELGDSRDVSPSVSDGKVIFGDAAGYIKCIKQDMVPSDDDDDGSLDLNDESDTLRDFIFIGVAAVIIIAVVSLIFFRKYLQMRKES
jgi:outer membrane protein assembly factor BamB